MKKILISLGLLALLCGCQTKEKVVDHYITQKPETVYVEVPVEVEKPIYVEKEVEVEKIVEKPVEVEKVVKVEKIVEVEKEVVKEVEVEKIVYVEKSYATINNMTVEVLGDNLYAFEFKSGISYNPAKTIDSQIAAVQYSINYTIEYNKKNKANLTTDADEKRLQDLYKLKEIQNIIDGIETGENGFKTKPGFIIQDITLICLDKMSTPWVFDNNYDRIHASNVDDLKVIASTKFEYKNLNKEQIIVKYNKFENMSGTEFAQGAGIIKIVFSLRGE